MDLLGAVLEAFPIYKIVMEPAPSYVKFYTKNSEDVIMINNKNKQAVTQNINIVDNKKEVFELTGSPLKLDLSMHTILDETMTSNDQQLWLKEETSHSPIPLEKARDIGNMYNELLRDGDKTNMVPMWILCDPAHKIKPLLLTAQSYKDCFARGIVTYEDCIGLDEIHVDQLIKKYSKSEEIEEKYINADVDCKYLLSGMSYDSSRPTEELLHAPHTGCTELACTWTAKTIQAPVITCKVNLEQEIIAGHLSSPCLCLWNSICALYSINQLLVDMTAAGYASINLSKAPIRRELCIKIPYADNTKRLGELLSDVETYTYTAQCQKGGFLCVTDDTVTLKQCLDAMQSGGSSNDFTYRLWDILKDCETAEDLVTLLLQALKTISSGKMKPFIDANNKTYLGKLVLKLSRGHSQTGKVLKNLRSNPPQALSLVGQVGVEKTMWEYTQLMSLVEHSFYITGIWANEVRTHESIDQINQSIYDMTMGGGDFTLNPFESKLAENSIRFDCESFYEDDPGELSVNEFASLKKHGLVPEDRKVANEVPLIVDEIDISGWKAVLMKFAQVHLCLEHLIRVQLCLVADFVSLKPLAARFREYYVSDRSPIKSVGQLMNDPIQKISISIANNMVKDHLKKPAFWYRVSLSKSENSNGGLKRDTAITHAYTQQPVFPPSVWQSLEPQSEEITEMTAIEPMIKYHYTKYTFISQQLASALYL